MSAELPADFSGYRVLESRSLFAFKGADRVRYLNGQVSNDVTKVSTASEIDACVLTAKGKLCGLVRIWASDANTLIVESERASHESLSERLERYIIADDVTFDDIGEEFRILHVIPGASSPNGGVLSNRFGLRGYDLLCPVSEVTSSAGDLANLGLNELSPEAADYLRILHGIPLWGRELGENTLPQEAGLDEDAVDFHKGCYVGQEVVSRIRSVGHVNRSLVGFEADAPFNAGAPILLAENFEVVGEITSVCPVFSLSKWIGMGYLKRGFDSPDRRFFAADPETERRIDIRRREFSAKQKL